MHFQVSGELKQFLDDCIKAGYFRTQAEVMRAALRRMKREYDREARINEETKIPNEETVKAMEEVLNGGGKKYKNSEEFYKDLGI